MVEANPKPINIIDQTSVIIPHAALNPIWMVIREGLISLNALVDHIDALEALAGDEPVSSSRGGYLVSDPEIYKGCKSIGDSLALASLTLFERKKLENRKDQTARSEKGEAVDALCAGIDVSVFFDRQLRDRMVHIDEWIPRMIRRFPDSPWVSGFGLTHRRLIGIGGSNSPIIYNRVFIFDEHRILHLEKELDIKALRRTCIQIIERMT